MKKISIPALIFASFALVSCQNVGTNNKAQTESVVADSTIVQAAVEGEWRIENVVINDSLYAMPREETPGTYSFITFGNDGTYFIRTNCNSISGSYTINRDSLTMGDGARTEMACDNMKVEDLIVKVLPQINNIDIQSDTVARLGSDSSACIILTRSKEPMI